MQSCPRSCPSRTLTIAEVAEIDKPSDFLSDNVVRDILAWKSSQNYSLSMKPFDVAVYDSVHHRFQEFQKARNEFHYQLVNGISFVAN